jgi:hypothetical protein
MRRSSAGGGEEGGGCARVSRRRLSEGGETIRRGSAGSRQGMGEARESRWGWSGASLGMVGRAPGDGRERRWGWSGASLGMVGSVAGDGRARVAMLTSGSPRCSPGPPRACSRRAREYRLERAGVVSESAETVGKVSEAVPRAVRGSRAKAGEPREGLAGRLGVSFGLCRGAVRDSRQTGVSALSASLRLSPSLVWSPMHDLSETGRNQRGHAEPRADS